MNGALQPFARATLQPLPFGQFLANVRANGALQEQGMSDEAVRAVYDATMQDECWLNDEYQVNIRRDVSHGFPGMRIDHLSIKRVGKMPIHDWRDLQAIKNMLVSPLAEAIELYPSSQRVVDGSNQYHLWVFISHGDEMYPQLPLGMGNIRAVTSEPLPCGRQRKLHAGGVTL